MRVVEQAPLGVSVAAFKRSVHIVDGVTDDDDLIHDLLVSAQDVVETATRRPMTERAVLIDAPMGPYGRWFFPVCPVVSVQSVAVRGADGSTMTLDAPDWRLDSAYDEPSLAFAPGVLAADVQAMQVSCRVGYGAGAPVPQQLVQAVKLIAKEWLDAGIALEAGAATPIAFGAKHLIRQVRYARPAIWAGC